MILCSKWLHNSQWYRKTAAHPNVKVHEKKKNERHKRKKKKKNLNSFKVPFCSGFTVTNFTGTVEDEVAKLKLWLKPD